MPESRGAKEQDDVLAKKNHVTKSSIGLQQWGDAEMGEGVGTSGTAERAARVAQGQKQKQPQKQPDDDAPA